MEDIMRMASNYGFPMVVAAYVLVRLEPVIKELQRAVNLLTLVVAKQSDIDVIEEMRQMECRKKDCL